MRLQFRSICTYIASATPGQEPHCLRGHLYEGSQSNPIDVCLRRAMWRAGGLFRGDCQPRKPHDACIWNGYGHIPVNMSGMEKLGVKDCNCGAMRKAMRRMSSFYDAQLAPSGLRATQFAILATLNEMGEVSINKMAEQMALDRTTAGKNLRPLEKAGLIKVAPSASDGRMRVITLSREGHNALKKAVPLWRAAQKSFEKWNGAENAAALRATLQGLRLES